MGGLDWVDFCGASQVIPTHRHTQRTHVLEERVPADALEEVVGLALRLDHLAGLHAVLADGVVEHLPVAALLRSRREAGMGGVGWGWGERSE